VPAAQYLGHELSDGDPLATAAGARAESSERGLHYAAKKQSDKAYAAGYDKGKSDAVKQQYWLYVSLQQQRATRSAMSGFTPCNCPNSALTG
jgi:hypothetical protein